MPYISIVKIVSHLLFSQAFQRYLCLSTLITHYSLVNATEHTKPQLGCLYLICNSHVTWTKWWRGYRVIWGLTCLVFFSFLSFFWLLRETVQSHHFFFLVCYFLFLFSYQLLFIITTSFHFLPMRNKIVQNTSTSTTTELEKEENCDISELQPNFGSTSWQELYFDQKLSWHATKYSTLLSS